MKKKNDMPQITYTEILANALAHINWKIVTLRDEKIKGLPEDHPLVEIANEMVKPLLEKRATLKLLYLIETGKEYDIID